MGKGAGESVEKNLKEKDTEIMSHKRKAEKLIRRNSQLNAKIKQLENNPSVSIPIDRNNNAAFDINGPNPTHVDEELSNFSNTTLSFVVNLVKSLGQDRVDLSSFSILEPGATVVEKKGDIQRILQGFLSKVVFWDFENEKYQRGGSTAINVPARCASYFAEYRELRDHTSQHSQAFDKFWREKWVLVSQVLLEQVKGKVNADKLSNALRQHESLFVPLALNAWKLHLLCFSFDPIAKILRFEKGQAVDKKYVKLHSYFEGIEGEDTSGKSYVTEFMIFPGIQIHSIVIPARVYPTTYPTSLN